METKPKWKNRFGLHDYPLNIIILETIGKPSPNGKFDLEGMVINWLSLSWKPLETKPIWKIRIGKHVYPLIIIILLPWSMHWNSPDCSTTASAGERLRGISRQAQASDSEAFTIFAKEFLYPTKPLETKPSLQIRFGWNDYPLIIIILETMGNQARVKKSIWMAWLSIDYPNPGNHWKPSPN